MTSQSCNLIRFFSFQTAYAMMTVMEFALMDHVLVSRLIDLFLTNADFIDWKVREGVNIATIEEVHCIDENEPAKFPVPLVTITCQAAFGIAIARSRHDH